MAPETAVVSLRAIATQAKVSRMTVSLALRGSREVSSATRQRIQSIARALGYQRNPELANLMGRLRAVAQSQRRITIALITNRTPSTTSKTILTHQDYLAGARLRAKELGFLTEEFCLFEDGMNGRRLSQVMNARGIEGAIIFPIVSRDADLKITLDWGRFALATCGYSLRNPSIHRSCTAHVRAVMEACGRLRAVGYRRLSLVVDRDQDRRAGHNWSAGFYAANHLAPSLVREPVFMPEALSFTNFSAWYRVNRPDAVLHVAREGEILSWLRRCGASVPDEVGYAFLDLWPSMMGAISGLHQPSSLVGAGAVDIVSAGIRYNEWGIPTHPRIVLTEAVWSQGRTTRPKPN